MQQGPHVQPRQAKAWRPPHQGPAARHPSNKQLVAPAT
ncbi:hypothetical protein A2U01_0111976, partial [Trifolium medium]|nr:hypothetical protein [Trifolium medium]